MVRGFINWYQVASVWYCDVDGLLLAVTSGAYSVLKVDGDDVLGCVDSGTVGTLGEGMAVCGRFIN